MTGGTSYWKLALKRYAWVILTVAAGGGNMPEKLLYVTKGRDIFSN